MKLFKGIKFAVVTTAIASLSAVRAAVKAASDLQEFKEIARINSKRLNTRALESGPFAYQYVHYTKKQLNAIIVQGAHFLTDEQNQQIRLRVENIMLAKKCKTPFAESSLTKGLINYIEPLFLEYTGSY